MSEVTSEEIMALSEALSTIESYAPTVYIDNNEPDINAEHLNHHEQGIKRVTDALNLAIGVINSQQQAITQLNSDIAAANSNIGQKYDANKVAPFVVSTKVVNGKGHVDYGKTLAGNGFAIIISNNMTYYYGIKSVTPTGFDFTLYENGAVANVNKDAFWVTGVAFMFW